MSGSENPENSENDSNGRRGNKRRNALLLGIIALALLSLFILLGNPGLLIPPKTDDNEAEAVGDDTNDNNEDTQNDVPDEITIPDSIDSTNNNSISDNEDNQPETETTDSGNDDNNSGSASGSTNNDDNESDPGTGSGGGDGSGGGSGGNGGSSHRPQAIDGNVETMLNTPVNIKVNATDFDGNTLTYAIVTQPLHGLLQDFDEDTGRLIYVPASGYTGTDSFSFMAEDFRLESDPAVIGITVNPIPNNSPPVANNIEVETDEDTSSLIDLISNVVDPEDDDVSLSIINSPENGNVALNDDGTATYTPDSNYFGQDSFTFQASDGVASSNVATVSITVDSVITIHMESTTVSYGSSLYSGRQIYAEYVTDSSSLVGKEIDVIKVELFRYGNPEGIAEIGVFNEDLSVKRLFGTIDVSTISSWPPVEYTFMLSDSEELYMIESGDRIGIKFDGGSESDNVQVKIDDDPADPFDGTNSYRTFFSNQWENRPEGDLWMILINTR